MALPTLSVTPGSGATINTLPNAPAITANSVSVALATDQATVPVSASTLPLPAGAATAANQATEISSLASILAAIQATDSAISITNRSGYVNGAVTAATIQAAGTAGGFAPGDTVTMPTGAAVTTPAALNVATTGVVAATVAAGGSGGTTGTQTVTGTTGSGTKFQASVTVSGGAITAVNSISLAGAYTVNPATLTAEPVTGGGLTGATLNIKMGIATLGVTTAGVYSAPVTNPIAPASTSASGSLTGVTVNLTAFSPLSTQVAASNTSRQYLAIRNESNSLNLGASLSGAASLGGVGTTAFFPSGGGFEWAGNRAPSNALTVIGQQAFQQFTAWEG